MPHSNHQDEDVKIVDDLIYSLKKDQSVLFASDVIDSWGLYKSLFEYISNLSTMVEIFEYSTSKIRDHNIHQIYDILFTDLFAERSLIMLAGGSVTIYNDPSSNLSVSFLKTDVAASRTKEWDVAFCEHLRNGGVGFGDEGRTYMLRLINNVAEQLPQEAHRLKRISECAIR